MHGNIVIKPSSGDDTFECRWCVNQSIASYRRPEDDQSTNWQSVDIVFKRLPFDALSSKAQEVSERDFGTAAAYNMVLKYLLALELNQCGALKLIVPQVHGYIIRSDIIPLRLVDCALVKSVVSFSGPQQEFEGRSIHVDGFGLLSHVFVISAAGIVVHPNMSMVALESNLLLLESELHKRLSIPWLISYKRPRRTLAIICGSRRRPEPGGPWPIFHKASEALDVDLIVLDAPGHWLEEPKYAHYRKDFIPMDVERNAGLPERIIEALRNYGSRIDGILASQESYSPLVALTAQKLSLPTSPPSALEIATDKYKTSISENHKAFRASSADEAMQIAHSESLSYPLIVKPCRGWSSEGVFRVQSTSELSDAAKAIDTDRHGTDFVIEQYCEGPEVDANLILCDGELLFFEVSDDFPKSADTQGTGLQGNFLEISNILPSNLPTHELDVLRTSLHQSLLKLGFRSGLFHLEARVHNSTMEYALNNGVTDLAPRQPVAKSPPSCWLIEINPRPPGIQATDAVAATYGIDYYGPVILFALGDVERARALSQPFAQGPQYYCEMVFIPADKGGIFDSDDVCEELLTRLPHLRENVSKAVCMLLRGERVPEPSKGQYAWVAYFTLFSRFSRKHLLDVSRVVREELRFSIV